MRRTARHWILALATAVLVHGGITVALLRQMPETGAAKPGRSGMVISLGSAGDAPGAVATKKVEAVTGTGAADVVETVRAAAVLATVRPAAVVEALRAATVVEAVRAVAETAGARPAALSAVVPPTSSEPKAAEPLAKPAATPVDTRGRPEPVAPVRGARNVVRTELIPTEPTTPQGPARPRHPTRPRPRSVRSLPGASSGLAAPYPVVPAETGHEAGRVGDEGRRRTPETSAGHRPLPGPASGSGTRAVEPVTARTADSSTVAGPSPPSPPDISTKPTVPDPGAVRGPANVRRLVSAPPSPVSNRGSNVRARLITGARTVPEARASVGSRHAVAGTPGQEADYLARVRAWLERHKRYPRRARLLRQEGTAMLYLVMDREGKLRDYEVRRSTGHELLDQAVVTMVERAQPFPSMPDSMTRSRLEIVVPVEFVLR